MANAFDRYYNKYDAWYDEHKFAFLSELEAVKKALPRRGKGLEIGCGTGRFAAELGIDIGIDPSAAMRKIARARGVKALPGRGEAIPFPDCAFDYAAIIITLCFVQDPAKVLAEAGRVLKKRGRIVIGIVDKNSFLGKFYKRKKSVFYKQAKFLSVKEVTKLIKQCGFGSFSYYQTLSVLPDAMRSAEHAAKGFGRGGFAVISAVKGKDRKKGGRHARVRDAVFRDEKRAQGHAGRIDPGDTFYGRRGIRGDPALYAAGRVD
jgi:ubiquinone/menaquinone biosynthesis C-methylase UbiE